LPSLALFAGCERVPLLFLTWQLALTHEEKCRSPAVATFPFGVFGDGCFGALGFLVPSPLSPTSDLPDATFLLTPLSLE